MGNQSSANGVVIGSDWHVNTSIRLAPLAFRVHTGCSAFPFYLKQNR